MPAPGVHRPALDSVEIGALRVTLAAEPVLDSVAKAEFRRVRWKTMAYVLLFFACTARPVGVASLVGRRWAVWSGIPFLAMAVLAFVQRARTGM